MKKKAVIEVIGAVFILLFAYTALSKLLAPEQFKWALGKSPLLGPFKDLIVWALPAIEIAVVGLLFIPSTRELGLYSTFSLMVAFTLYVAYMIAFAHHLPCSCGGIIQDLTWKQHLILNIVLTLLAGVALRLNRQSGSFPGAPRSVAT